MRFARYAVVVVGALVTIPLAAAENPQKAGKWRVNMQMEMTGVPMKLPPVSVEMCLTEEDLKDPEKSVPKDPKSDCRVLDYRIEGQTVSWKMDCPKQNVKGDGTITFSDTSYDGVMNMQMGEQEMKTKYTGKWLGACSK